MHCALDSVSFSINPGALTAILGPSGSGKSTTLSLIAGIASPSRGTIAIGGRDVTEMPAAHRNIGLVFQSYALFPHLSVYENVAFPLRIRRRPQGEIAAQVGAALERVRLQELKDRRPDELSGGQQQRVAIARAIVFEPSVLLLDEPLAALDRKLREQVRLELRQMQRDLGITAILVTHDQEEAMSMADEVVILADGRIQQIDEPQTAYRQPANEFVANFLGTANLFEGPVTQIGEARYIRLACGDTIAIDARAGSARPDGVAIGMLRPEQITLGSPDAAGATPARIEEQIFLGESIRYLATTERGTTITIQASNARRIHRPGERVGLSWTPEDVWILPSRSSRH
ncbi:ABC transporter ATP-binding protein [Rhodoligotrophos defluvii]|uniref:ABC transporter ATP-binding protein n=1 Tax=Rhodoligotrophos defluvii TaxID=2561934 RepID=UPI0014859A9A|nr:ABC transporter ATP-binding protein [Rhodoligotrophos defluvii]